MYSKVNSASTKPTSQKATWEKGPVSRSCKYLKMCVQKGERYVSGIWEIRPRESGKAPKFRLMDEAWVMPQRSVSGRGHTLRSAMVFLGISTAFFSLT